MKETLQDRLTSLSPLPPGQHADVAYILGGPPHSLRRKFRVAGTLSKRGAIDAVWIMSVTGITKYSTKLGRNLTYDEWSLERLEYNGVPAAAVEPIPVAEGFFGTLSEAGSIAAQMEERGLGRIVVVSSPHHTRRVKLCFDHYLGPGKTLFIEGSTEKAPLHVLVREYCKLRFYELLLWFRGAEEERLGR